MHVPVVCGCVVAAIRYLGDEWLLSEMVSCDHTHTLTHTFKCMHVRLHVPVRRQAHKHVRTLNLGCYLTSCIRVLQHK